MRIERATAQIQRVAEIVGAITHENETGFCARLIRRAILENKFSARQPI